jgi:hypothetical protein
VTAYEQRAFSGSDESALDWGGGNGCTTLWTYFKTTNCTLQMGWTVSELYPKEAIY